MNKIIKIAVLNASSTAVYVGLIVSSIFYAPKFVDLPDGQQTVLVPIMMLLLFVFSAALTGLLVFGRPILWYLDGKKKEAVYLLVYTLGTLLAVVVLAALVLYLKSR